MGKFQKILLFTILSLPLYFIANAEELCVRVSSEKTATISEEGLHALAFIQPESLHHFVFNEKTADTNFVKCFANPDFGVLSATNLQICNSFVNQDIDRCESVSLLLFPYHIFW